MVRKQLIVLSALIMVAMPAEAVAASSVTLTPTFGAVSGEPQDPGYLYRSLPGLQYISWTDAAGATRQRFIRSFQISADDGSLKSRVQYHTGGSMTDTANWRPALDATTGRELLYTSDYAKVISTFRSGGETVAIDEKADMCSSDPLYLQEALEDPTRLTGTFTSA